MFRSHSEDGWRIRRALTVDSLPADYPAMGFSKGKMEETRRQEAEKEAAARRATDRQILEDAEQLVTAWNERQAKRMPMLFSPTIGAAITAVVPLLPAECVVRRMSVPVATERHRRMECGAGQGGAGE